MALTLTNMMCCGVKELSGLSTCRDATDAMLQFGKLTHLRVVRDDDGKEVKAPFDRFRYVVFTQAKKADGYGIRFAELIEDQGLGEIIETKFRVNPNSGNNVKVWVWTVDHKAVKEWLDKNAKGLEVAPVEGPPGCPILPPQRDPSVLHRVLDGARRRLRNG